MADYQNYASAENQANQLGLQRQDAQNQAALMYQQGQKYAPTQLQAMGLGNTGLSETSQVGLMNTYSNIVNQTNRDYASGMNKMYQDLAAANRENQMDLTNQLTSIKQKEQDIAREDKLLADKIAREDYLLSLEKEEQLRKENLAKEEANKKELETKAAQEKELLMNRYLTELQSAYDQNTLDAIANKYSSYFAENPNMQAYLNAAQNSLNYSNKQQEDAKTAAKQEEINNYISSVYDKDMLKKYYEANKETFSEQNKQLFDHKIDTLTTAYDNALLQSQYGVNLDEGIKIGDITTSALNLTKSLPGKQKNQEKVLEFIKQNPNYYEGKVIDLDFSYKTQNYVVYKGMLYPTDRKAVVKAQAILNKYNEEEESLKSDK